MSAEQSVPETSANDTLASTDIVETTDAPAPDVANPSDADDANLSAVAATAADADCNSSAVDADSTESGATDVATETIKNEGSSDAGASPDEAPNSEEPSSETADGSKGESDVQSEPSSESESETAKPRRGRLNPGPSPDAKAIPFVSTPLAKPTSDGSEELLDEAESVASIMAAAMIPTELVELPPSGVDLDQDLEAEIEAAMSSEETRAIEVAATEDDAGAESLDATIDEWPEEGSRMSGLVQGIHGDNVFLDLGFRSPGVLQLRQLESPKAPKFGTSLDIIVNQVDVKEGLIHVSMPMGKQRIGGNWDAVTKGQIVDCLVEKSNKGGLEVTVGGLRGFLPAGQIDFRYIEDLDPFIGQKLQVKITEVDKRRKNIVVSRRAFLQIERKQLEEQLWIELKEGDTRTGTVKTLKDYGAFVDLGGVDGFLHVGQISWMRIEKPSEVLHEGQTVDIKILSIDREKKKISLGMKQLSQNPWSTAEDKYAVGSIVSGKIGRIMDFGAFVVLESGVEGLLHISELDHRRVRRVTDVVAVDQTVDVKVLEVDTKRRRIALSLKALKAAPEEEPAVTEAEERESAESIAATKKRRASLKGGNSQSKGSGSGAGSGGLFGNPGSFS